MIFLTLLAIVGNASATSITNIQEQFDRMTCPMPASPGLWNSSNTLIYANGTYNYPNINNQTLTLTCTEIHTADNIDYYYGIFTIQPFFSNGTGFSFGVPMGEFIFMGDFLASLGDKIGAFFTILYYILTPANFNILGFTIADLSGIPLMVIIGIYALCYIAIGALLYKIISPFAGAS